MIYNFSEIKKQFVAHFGKIEGIKQFLQFEQSAIRFIGSKFSVTPPGVLATREATCRACPEWDATALTATGRCRKCGCSTWAKLRMATERCPLGKWEAISSTSVPPVSSVVNPLPPASEATRKGE
jgi:hypothetical protein